MHLIAIATVRQIRNSEVQLTGVNIKPVLYILYLFPPGDIYHWKHQEIHQQSICLEDLQKQTHQTQTKRWALLKTPHHTPHYIL